MSSACNVYDTLYEILLPTAFRLGCKSLSFHLHASTIFHQHVGNHKTLHSLKHMLNRSAFRLLPYYYYCCAHSSNAFSAISVSLVVVSCTRRKAAIKPNQFRNPKITLKLFSSVAARIRSTFTTKQPQICFSMVSMVRHGSQKSQHHCLSPIQTHCI